MKAGKATDFYDQVREVVHYRWDPIGIAAYSEEMGEYDGYIPALCELLEKTVDPQQVFDFLWAMETESMGLDGDLKATQEFSSWLYQLARKCHE